jgi:hypothetical protein
MAIRSVLSGIDIAPLLAQVRAHPELWDIDDSWVRNKPQSAIYEVSNIVLRFNRSPDWDKPARKLLSEAEPIIDALMQAVGGVLLGKALITRLGPGQGIKRHWDRLPPGVPLIYHHFKVPLTGHPDCVFGCGDGEMHLDPGQAYWFNNQDWHWVVNGPEERLEILLGIQPGPQFLMS